MGVTKNDNLGGVLMKEIQRISGEPDLCHGEVYEQQIEFLPWAESNAKRECIRPERACRIHISPYVDSCGYLLQFFDQLSFAHIPRVENELRTMLSEEWEQGRVRSPVGIGKDGNKVLSHIGQFDRPGNVSLGH